MGKDRSQQYPISERLRHRVDAETLKELEAVERTAGAKFVYAASNGVLRRWWDIGSKVATIAAFIWFVSAKWTALEHDMEWVKQVIADQPSAVDVTADISRLRADVSDVKSQISEVAESTDVSRINTARVLSDVRRRLSAIESSLKEAAQ